MIDYEKCNQAVNDCKTIKGIGKVVRVVGLTIESKGPMVHLGEHCFIKLINSTEKIDAEVVGFNNDMVLLMPLGDMKGIGHGCEVIPSGRTLSVAVGKSLLGRVLDGLGNPMDGLGPIEIEDHVPVDGKAPDPLERMSIEKPLSMGVRAIDSTLTFGIGQRVGVFAGSGVGKSTLLGMISRNSSADINVIALVGERGREVKEFLEKDLGAEGMKNTVVIVATSDKPALVRLKGAAVATAIAEYFRDHGYSVMFMMDSLTRFAMAQREIGLAVGEPPATRGYTPSVFAELPKLLERTGNSAHGSITAIYTVLVDGDDMNDPIADTVRGILDGHIVLSRELASMNHYPAIDVLGSVSRVMNNIVPELHAESARKLREVLAVYKEAEDLINIGAYKQGSNPKIDHAIAKISEVTDFLKQSVYEKSDIDKAVEKLEEIFYIETHQDNYE